MVLFLYKIGDESVIIWMAVFGSPATMEQSGKMSAVFEKVTEFHSQNELLRILIRL